MSSDKQENPEIASSALTRRQLLAHAGKAAYVAPALVLLSFTPGSLHAEHGIPHCPPPPPGGNISCETGPSTTNAPPKKERRKD